MSILPKCDCGWTIYCKGVCKVLSLKHQNIITTMPQNTYAIAEHRYHRYGFLIEEPVTPEFLQTEEWYSKNPTSPKIPINDTYYQDMDDRWVRKVEVIILGVNIFDAVDLFKKLYGPHLNVVSIDKYSIDA